MESKSTNPQLKDKGNHTFVKGINTKVSVKAQLDFDFAYYYVTAEQGKHKVTGTPLTLECCINTFDRPVN